MITECGGCQLQETRRVFSTRFMIQLNGGISQQTFLIANISLSFKGGYISYKKYSS